MTNSQAEDAIIRARILEILELPDTEFIKDGLDTARDLIASGNAMDRSGIAQAAIVNACQNIAILNSETEVEALQWFLERLVQIETE